MHEKEGIEPIDTRISFSLLNSTYIETVERKNKSQLIIRVENASISTKIYKMYFWECFI